MHSDAPTVEAYLASLPEERREVIRAVREVILNHLPAGYEEVMNWSMISYEVPLSICPVTYNQKPLMYAALASQKQHMSIYLCGVYGMENLRQRLEVGYQKAGKKLSAGASCVRFKKLEDLPLALIGELIAAVPVDEFVAHAESCRTKKGL